MARSKRTLSQQRDDLVAVEGNWGRAGSWGWGRRRQLSASAASGPTQGEKMLFWSCAHGRQRACRAMRRSSSNHDMPTICPRCAPADIAMVCAQLELRPGAVVLESGTGSGSLTHSLARAVGPAGQVWTYEFHEQRAQMAAEGERAGQGRSGHARASGGEWGPRTGGACGSERRRRQSRGSARRRGAGQGACPKTHFTAAGAGLGRRQLHGTARNTSPALGAATACPARPQSSRPTVWAASSR